MKLIPVSPGSPEWRQARVGLPTASQAHRVVTASGKPSSQRETYMHELVAERLLGTWLDDYAGDFAARGSALESEAVSFFELAQNVDTASGGFCTTDDGKIGCSPDRLIMQDGQPIVGLEIKAPKPSTHVGYLMQSLHGDKYHCQIQCSLMVTGLPLWFLMSYHPGMPPALLKIERDEPFIKVLRDRLEEFCDHLEAATDGLRARQEMGR